jgi:hypothetical protein
VRFVVDKVALGQMFPSTVVSPTNSYSSNCSTFTIIIIIIIIRGWYSESIIGQGKVPRGLSLIPSKKNQFLNKGRLITHKTISFKQSATCVALELN